MKQANLAFLQEIGSRSTEELAEIFHREGFLHVRDVIPAATIEKTRTFLEQAVQESLESILEETGCATEKELICQSQEIIADQARFEKFAWETQQILTGHFNLETRLSPHLRVIPQCRALQQILKAVLDADGLRMHLPPTARFVLPGNQMAGVPPHQDISYNKHMSDFVTCWITLVPIDDNCGGVGVHLGSGQLEEIPVGKTGFWLDGIEGRGFETHHVKAEPGDILLLNKWVVHQSMPNTSNRIRISVDQRFFRTTDASSKHFLEVESGEVVAPLSEP